MKSITQMAGFVVVGLFVLALTWMSCSGPVGNEEKGDRQEVSAEVVTSSDTNTEAVDDAGTPEQAKESVAFEVFPDRSGTTEDPIKQKPEAVEEEAVPEEASIEQVSESSSSATYQLVVNDGYGSGAYPAGAIVHVWAKFNPYQQLVVGWKGGDNLLKQPKEWHTTFVMPARDVTLSPQFVTAQGKLQTLSFQGVKYKKPVLALIPPNPKGVILAFHGTGGSHKYLQKLETLYLARIAYRRGYAVVSTDAEEVQAGDTDKNGKIRWNPNIRASNNVDVRNLQLLGTSLVDQKILPKGLPLFAFGMSNGGAMSVSVGEALKMKAVVSYCASGRRDTVAITKTPTMWLMCQKDSNPQVDNSLAKQHHQTLLGRKVPTVYDSNPPSPLYDGRFFRILGINLPTSANIAKELRTNKHVDAKGFFIGSSEAFVKGFQANKKAYPVLSGLKGGLQADVLSQVKIMMADHNMYDDFSSRTIDFFDKYR